MDIYVNILFCWHINIYINIYLFLVSIFARNHALHPIIAWQDNWLLITADYSQIELRLMAHFSKDSALIELLSKPDGDVFTMIAARWTNKVESVISSKERENTKRLIYGILYGMGANSLAEQLNCSSEEAAEKIKSFKASFPGVSSWLHEAVASCRKKGLVYLYFFFVNLEFITCFVFFLFFFSF